MRTRWLPLLALCLTATPGFGALASDDFADMQVIAQAVNGALETTRTGDSVAWSNAATGNGGAITVSRTWYRNDGVPCRAYERTTRVAGKTDRVVKGTGCRGANAIWRLTERTDKPADAAESTPSAAPEISPPPRKQNVPKPERAATKPPVEQARTAPRKPKPQAAIPPPAPPKPTVVTAGVPSRSDE